MKILGIESSCDETSAAIVTDSKEILSHQIYSQLEHNEYGGVVPEIAARAHIKKIDQIIEKTFEDANCDFSDIDAIAVTAGPGLIGGLIVGITYAKAMASSLKIPFIAVNHLEAHALTVRLTSEVKFPYLMALLSGGHSQIMIVEGVGRYRLIGKTIDDALGEAFDKTAKMLGLGYPGGPIIEKNAIGTDRFKLPRPLINEKNCDFSFSGLKTAVRRVIAENEITQDFIQDISTSFQNAIGDILISKLNRAIEIYSKEYDNKNIVIAGGVAANQYIKSRISEIKDFNIITPPLKLCTDNGAMIAWAGIERYKLNKFNKLDFNPKARWPLEDLAAE